jgi:hypothetical protein
MRRHRTVKGERHRHEPRKPTTAHRQILSPNPLSVVSTAQPRARLSGVGGQGLVVVAAGGLLY